MRKITLLAATALALTCFGGQAFTVQAAPEAKGQVCLGDNQIIITYKSDCNIQNILDKLESCFPSISLPDCELPGGNIPDVDLPENNEPEAGVPDIDVPENNKPETDIPETDVPEIDVPETDAPEADFPENDIPETEEPETNLPENNTPDNTPENDSDGGNTPEESPESEHAFIKRVVELVNIERAKEGLSPLTIDANVQAAAMVRAKECEELFSHTRPNGTSFATALKEQNVSYRRAGENIAWGQKTPEEVVAAWMNSSGHRANIMNPNFTSIGVGYYENARGTDYWCQLFIG